MTYSQEAYQRNKASILAAKKRYYEKNREKIIAKQKEYDDAHREQISARFKEKKYGGGVKKRLAAKVEL